MHNDRDLFSVAGQTRGGNGLIALVGCRHHKNIATPIVICIPLL